MRAFEINVSFCKVITATAMATLPEAVWPLNPPVTNAQEASDVTFAASAPRHLTSTYGGGLEGSSMAFNHNKMS